MPLLPVSLSKRSNPARYKQGGSAACINCYIEEIGEDGKTPWAIYASDGLQGYASLDGADGGVRNAINVDGTLYVVAGLTLYSVNSAGAVTTLGSMSFSTTAPVYMERNRAATPDISIVCDGVMYNYKTSLAQVTDADLLAPTSLAFIDGYFIIGTANNTWQISAIDDGTAWDPLDTERADANPDAVVRVAALQRDAVIFGEVSTEFHRNTGAADFPFERVAAIDLGCLAPASVQSVDQTLAWIANDRTVRMLNGYQGVRISTHAIERLIEEVADYATIQSASWTRDGHTFYMLSSPDWTWIYDTITREWHERKSSGRSNWLISSVVEFAGKVIAGARDAPELYDMSRDYLDEAGTPLQMVATLPPVHAFPNPLTFNAVYIDAEKGVGTGTGATEDVDPEIVLKWSRDGGYTFGAQRALKLGQQGKRINRIHTHRLGQSTADGYVFQIEASTRTVRALYQLTADVEKDAA